LCQSLEEVLFFRYVPIRTPARKLMGTPTPYGGTPLYQIPDEERTQQFDVPKEIEGLPEMKPEDQQYFGKLLKEVSMLMSSVQVVCFISAAVSCKLRMFALP